MARVKRSVHSKKRRRTILEAAEGYSGSRSRHVRKANEQVMHSGNYAYRDRRPRKGDFRRLWLVRITASCREHVMSYSRFVAGLKREPIDPALSSRMSSARRADRMKAKRTRAANAAKARPKQRNRRVRVAA